MIPWNMWIELCVEGSTITGTGIGIVDQSQNVVLLILVQVGWGLRAGEVGPKDQDCHRLEIVLVSVAVNTSQKVTWALAVAVAVAEIGIETE